MARNCRVERRRLRCAKAPPPSLDDFTFEFLLASGDIMAGIVQFGLLPGVLLPGDYNGNGVVDQGDYNQRRTTFGQSIPTGSGADGNGNGVIDAADYTLWRDKLRNNAKANSLSVPEPAGSILAAGAFLAYVGVSQLKRNRKAWSGGI